MLTFALGGSVTCSRDPADHGSTGSTKGVIFQVVAMPRWGATNYENQVRRTRPFRCASGVLRNVHRT
jgi:hypothetical protein